jgi:uncharacterized protein (TIGR03435 family)
MPMLFLLAGVPLRAQAVAPPAAIAEQSAETPTEPFTFDVVSIKPSGPSDRGYSGFFDDTGYSSRHFALYWTVLKAYFSSFRGHDIIGMPDWLTSERYDITARIDEADIPAWMKLSPRQREQPGQPLLQKLLAERCKLVAHTVPVEMDGYTLVVGKGGARLSASKPGATYPADAKNLWDGGKIVQTPSGGGGYTLSFFNASMEQLADRMQWAWVIVDRTSLTGRYDFTIRQLRLPVDAEGNRIPDPQPADMWDLSGTGLEIKRAKLPSENLVIDHIERPSAN